jgi:mono/diheme cytochrome c family protein
MRPSFFFWRISEGVPGTVMPQWEQSLSESERWLAIDFIQGAYMDMVPHFTDEGDMPGAYAQLRDPVKETTETLTAGKAIYVMNCAFCHGYGGRGDGPNARGLQPGPPDFNDTATYDGWTPADYFWRVSESLPMRAMPQWRYWFDEDQRWLVSNYVRSILVFPNPDAEPADPEMPTAAEDLKIPASAEIMRGRVVYLQRCWMCHGDAGQADGPSAAHLSPAPANFADPAIDEVTEGELFWRTTAGIGMAAMPQWGLLLSEEDRWAALRYVKNTFISPSEPADVSDELPVEYQALQPSYENTGSAQANGKTVYQTYCQGCHGPKALGDGQFGAPLMPTPANLAEDPAFTSPPEWWYWRIDQGVVGTTDGKPHPTAMPAWRFILTDEQKWNVIFYTRALVNAPEPKGGN